MSSIDINVNFTSPLPFQSGTLIQYNTPFHSNPYYLNDTDDYYYDDDDHDTFDQSPFTAEWYIITSFTPTRDVIFLCQHPRNWFWVFWWLALIAGFGYPFGDRIAQPQIPIKASLKESLNICHKSGIT